MTDLKDKVILITGASSGIGRGCAKHFASLGCKLSLHGRNPENLQKTIEECVASGLDRDKIVGVLGDLGDENVCRKVFEETVRKFKQLHVLVNNAGFGVPGSIETATLEDFDSIVKVNIRAPFHLSQLAAPYLKETKGSIVNVSSLSGTRSFPDQVVYGMSKAALDQITRCSSLDLAKYGVRVNSVNPGVIVTGIHKRSRGMSDEAYAEFLEHEKTTHALGRVGNVDEVVKCIAFLASEDSSFITGSTVPIDGGRHAMCPR